MTVSFSTETSIPEAQEKLSSLPARYSQALYRATEQGTGILARQLEQLVVNRTTMGAAMAQRIVEQYVGPYPGAVAQGRVGFKPPPAFFYPKHSKALRFTIGGRTIFAKRVRGSRPYRLVPRAVLLGENAVEDTFNEEVGKVEV